MKDKNLFDEGFTTLYARYRQRLVGYLRNRLCGDRDTAEDLAQDLFVKLYEKRETPEDRGASSYLHLAARRRLYDYTKRRKIEERAYADASAFDGNREDMSDQYHRAEIEQRVMEAIEKFPALKRTVFVERCIHGRRIVAIARVHGVSAYRVKRIAAEGRDEIRKALRHYAAAPGFPGGKR